MFRKCGVKLLWLLSGARCLTSSEIIESQFRCERRRSMRALRVRCVRGHEGRANDALFLPAARLSPHPHTLVFFGGDVQDYPEAMETHRDNKNYVKWNLESTAKMLGEHFPFKHVVVVRPSRIEYKSFSCYDNFVPSNAAGVPEHTPTHNALRHLQSLLKNITSRLKALPVSAILEHVETKATPEEIDIEDLHNATIHRAHTSSESDEAAVDTKQDPPASSIAGVVPDTQSGRCSDLWWRSRLNLDQSSLMLVGFSKGCVVLNQFTYEFHYTQTLAPGDEDMVRFISRIESMCWLDGGHAGGKNTWITSRSLLETLTRLDINIDVHVSPYQVKDDSRPWIGREERAFTSLLRLLGAKISRFEHGVGATQDLHMHFSVLTEFARTHNV